MQRSSGFINLDFSDDRRWFPAFILESLRAGVQPNDIPAIDSPMAQGRSRGRFEHLNHILHSLLNNNPYIEGTVLLSNEGLVMASALPPHWTDAIIAELCSTLYKVGHTTASQLGHAPLTDVMVRSKHGDLLVMVINARAWLACITFPETKLGLVLLDMRHATEHLRTWLQAGDSQSLKRVP
ncbi:MAG: roadblock/LC7 domain-containing protein [Myxococcales bacterium]|nr:roadblock/LC7 domain-containing protein [Myxococcales bacterium]